MGFYKYIRSERACKKSFLYYSLFFEDFFTPPAIRTSALIAALKNYSSAHLKAGPGFSFIQGLSEYADIVATISGSLLDYPVSVKLLFGYENFLKIKNYLSMAFDKLSEASCIARGFFIKAIG